MQQSIQFETVIESGIIRVPEQYATSVPAAVKVTLIPVDTSRVIMGAKAKAGAISSNDFNALKIDTTNWKFDREEANER